MPLSTDLYLSSSRKLSGSHCPRIFVGNPTPLESQLCILTFALFLCFLLSLDGLRRVYRWYLRHCSPGCSSPGWGVESSWLVGRWDARVTGWVMGQFLAGGRMESTETEHIGIKECSLRKRWGANKQVNVLCVLSLCPPKQGDSLCAAQTPFDHGEQDKWVISCIKNQPFACCHLGFQREGGTDTPLKQHSAETRTLVLYPPSPTHVQKEPSPAPF